MLERAVFGEITVKIDGFNTSILCEKLHQECKVKSLYTKSDSIILTTLGTHEKRVTRLCEEQSCICEILEKKGAIYAIKKYFRRFGFYIGALVTAVFIFILSNTVMRFEIVGTDDEALKTELCALMREEGVKAGAYIPSINFLELSTKLHERCEGISWASVGSVGSVIYVNVYENTAKPKAENMRIPCNIVADKDAFIVKAEVRVGRLEVIIGDAVCKGKVLVSGILEHRSGVANYVHSYAKIIGRYEENIDFEQKYIENSRFSAEKIYRRSLSFFDFEIPFFGKSLKNGSEYTERRQSTHVKLCGFTLPISVNDYEYTEQKEDIKVFSDAEALSELYKKLENYEKNILSDVEIIEKEVSEDRGDEGVKLSVKYLIEGEIGRDSEIFVR